MWSLKKIWPFTKRKHTAIQAKNPSPTTEIEFLAQLAQVESLAKEQLVMDGAALVVQISHQKLVSEVVVEVRLPGWINWLSNLTPSKEGFLWVYLQNISDEPLRFRAPDFILTGGLKLPWKAGVQLMHNFYRGEIAEVLSWQVPITGNEDLESLA